MPRRKHCVVVCNEIMEFSEISEFSEFSEFRKIREFSKFSEFRRGSVLSLNSLHSLIALKNNREASHDGSLCSRNKFCKTTNPNLNK